MNQRQPCAGYCECGHRIYGEHERCWFCRETVRWACKAEREERREDEPRREYGLAVHHQRVREVDWREREERHV